MAHKISKSVMRKRIFKTKKNDEIKIFAFADTHGSMKYFEKLKENITLHSPAFVICAGDFTMMSKQMEFFLYEFNKFKVPFMLVQGNHESADKITDYLEEVYLKNIIFVHKNLVSFKNICITGFGGEGFTSKTPELDQYAEIVRSDLKKRHCKFKIFVPHAPPYNTKLDMVNDHHCGSASVANTIKKLKFDLCICGHIHEANKMFDKLDDCVVVNPSRDGAIITLDKDYKIKSIEFLK